MSSVLDPGVLANETGTPVTRRRFAAARHPLVRVRRLLLSIPLLLLVSMLVFVLMSIVPGDVTYQLLGPEATAQQRAELFAELGLTSPFPCSTWIGSATRCTATSARRS